MTMSFNTAGTAGGPQNKEQTAAAIRYLRQGLKAQAFLILNGINTDNDPAAKFAMGLCRLGAGELSAAIDCFERTVQMLKNLPPAQRPGAENNETHIKLTVQQINDRTWLTPMDADLISLFPKAAEQTAMLALIHCYQLNGMPDMARKVAAALTGPAFDEFRKKIMQPE